MKFLISSTHCSKVISKVKVSERRTEWQNDRRTKTICPPPPDLQSREHNNLHTCLYIYCMNFACIFFMEQLFLMIIHCSMEIAIIQSFVYSFKEFHDDYTYLQRELCTVIIFELIYSWIYIVNIKQPLHCIVNILLHHIISIRYIYFRNSRI